MPAASLRDVDRTLASAFAHITRATSLASLVGFGTAAIVFKSPSSLVIAGVSALLAAVSWWQILTGEYRVAPIQYSVIVSLWIAAGLLFGVVPEVLTTAIVVTILVGGLVIEERSLHRYLIVSAAIYASLVTAHMVARGSSLDETMMLRHAIESISLSFGIVTVTVTRRIRARTQGRYEHLSSKAPVALFEEDFLELAPWFDRLRADGVTDLDSYLDDRPEELLEMIRKTRMARINPAAVALLGADSSDRSGSDIATAVLSPDGIATFREQFVSLWEGRTSGTRVVSGLRLDGGELHATLSWSVEESPFAPPYSQILMAMTDIATVRDEANKRLLIESEHRAITDSITSAVITFGSDGNIRTYNRKTQTLFGYTLEEVIGRPITTLMPERFREAHNTAMARIFENGQRPNIKPLELVALKSDGSEFPVEVSVGSWDWNGEMIHTGILTDISERVANRHKLEASHTALIDLVSSKDQLIASVSHQIRTPLTSIYGYAAILVEEAESLSAEKKAEFHRVIAEQSSDISDILEDLLVASRTNTEAISLNAAPVSLAATAREVIHRYRDKEEVRFEIVGEADALADAVRLRQIIRNLVANVIRHGGSTCQIDILRDASIARLLVSDDGPGVPAGSAEHIFEPFHIGANNGDLSAESIGIGLSISRRLARLMGGDLTYRQHRGWTTFELTAPGFGAAGTDPTRRPSGVTAARRLAPELAEMTPNAESHATRSVLGAILEVGNPAESGKVAFEAEGRVVMGCRGPGSGKCPLVDGDGCDLASSATGITFRLDLDDAYNRQILRCYRTKLGRDVPIRVIVKPGDRERYAKDLVGTVTVEDSSTATSHRKRVRHLTPVPPPETSATERRGVAGIHHEDTKAHIDQAS